MALKRPREADKRERHVPLFLRAGGELSDGMGGMSHDDGRSMHPIFFLKHQKENGPHPQGVCRIRKRHSRQRLRNARSKEKMPGANLHMRVSSLKTGVFRICADWNRKSSAGSRHSPAFEVHFPAGLVWGNFVEVPDTLCFSFRWRCLGACGKRRSGKGAPGQI